MKIKHSFILLISFLINIDMGLYAQSLQILKLVGNILTKMCFQLILIFIS